MTVLIALSTFDLWISLLESASDPQFGFGDYSMEVRVGPVARMPRLPAMFFAEEAVWRTRQIPWSISNVKTRRAAGAAITHQWKSGCTPLEFIDCGPATADTSCWAQLAHDYINAIGVDGANYPRNVEPKKFAKIVMSFSEF